MRYRVLIRIEDNDPDSAIESSVAYDDAAENLPDLRSAVESVVENVLRAASSPTFNDAAIRAAH